MWDLVTDGREIEVTTLRQSRSQPGIRVHRATTLDPLTDVDRQPDGLPLTTPMRTLQDLAATVDRRRLRRACRKAELLRLIDTDQIRDGVRGAERLRKGLAELVPTEPQMTRSELEERFLDLVAEAGLPAPETNVLVAGFECDFVWRAERLVVETDGRAAHLTPTAFERDRARDAELTAKGWRVVRFTQRHVVREKRRVVDVLRAAARAVASPGGRRAA